MSPDRDAAGSRPRRGRALVLLLAGLVAAAGLFVWLAFPWGTIDGLRVDGAHLAGSARPGEQAAQQGTSRRIVVTFSTPKDLATVRREEGARFVNAVLSACGDADVSQRLDVVGGYFREGRVEALPPVGPVDARRYRYRATFDDWLPLPQASGGGHVNAAEVGGGACFSLEGGAMWLGKLWSDRIPLRLAASPAPAP